MTQPELDKKYQEIIKTCKFIAKPNTWFVEGLEVKCVDTCSYAPYKNQDTFNAGWGLFEGWTNETFIGFDGELPREDGETCQFDEFYIYDKFGNEISEITLSEYELLSINNGTPTPNINGDSKTGKLKKVNGNWVVEAILADSDSSEYYCIPLYELKDKSEQIADLMLVERFNKPVCELENLYVAWDYITNERKYALIISESEKI